MEQKTVVNVNVGSTSKRDSWPGIVLWLILFFPWGIFKLIRRITG